MAYLHPRCSDHIADKTCLDCGEAYKPTSRAQRYCSLLCRGRAQHRRHAAKGGNPHWRLVGKVCGACGETFTPRTEMSSNAKFCSDACRVEGIRRYQKRFRDMNPEAQSIYNRARDMKNGKKDTLQTRLYRKYPDLPRQCEACGLDEDGILEAAHKPGFERNGGQQVMKFYERHMFWMLCPNDHKRLDKKLKTPEELGLV